MFTAVYKSTKTKGIKMSFIYKSSDRVNKPKLATKGDMAVLEARDMVKNAKNAIAINYITAELKRRMELRIRYKDENFIKRCETIKQNLSKNNKDFEKNCNDMADSLIVEAVLKNRKEMGSYTPEMLPLYIKVVVKNCFGKEM